MKKTTKRNKGIGYYFLNSLLNVFESVLIGVGVMAIFYCLTKFGIIDYTITSSLMELSISFISGILIFCGITFKMQIGLIRTLKTQIDEAYMSGKEKGHKEGYHEGYKKGCTESTDKLLRKSEKYFNIARVK